MAIKKKDEKEVKQKKVEKKKEKWEHNTEGIPYDGSVEVEE